MVLSLVRKEGVAALAYSANDVSVLWPCSLKILHSDAQFVVSLEHSYSIHGFDDKQLFTLRYEGDNLMPGKTSLGDVDISLPDGSLHDIARHGQPRLRTLSLTLKTPCSVWCPHSFGNGMSSLETSFHKLSTLARATDVRIVFDTNWLGKKNLARLRSAVEASRQLTGVPVIPQFARLYQQADWSIVSSIQGAKSGPHRPTGDLTSKAVPSIEDAVAGAPPFEDAIYDAPPSYAQVSNKRSRNSKSSSRTQHQHIADAHRLARTSLTPDSPPPKRLLQDPTCVPSPTEHASSASSPSSKSTPSSTATVQVDIFQDIVTSAVQKVLPDMLREQLPSILQDFLPGMLADPSPSPSLSPIPRSSQSADTLAQHRRTLNKKPTPAAVIRTVISTATKTHLQKFLTDALDEAYEQVSELHNSASVEFEEHLDDTRLDFAMLKEDHIAAFNEDCNEKLVEFKERLVEGKDEAEVDVKAHADEVVVKAWDRLNMMDKRWCSHQCPHSTKDKGSKLGETRRAISLPP
jgi:hypothetical protein